MKLINILFCDDIRHEINGKLSLMGLYYDRIILKTTDTMEVKLPIPINLAILFRFSMEREESFPDRFEFEFLLNNKVILNIKGKLTPTNNNSSALNLALNGIGIPVEPGNLGFSIKLYAAEKLKFSETQAETLQIIKQ